MHSNKGKTEFFYFFNLEKKPQVLCWTFHFLSRIIIYFVFHPKKLTAQIHLQGIESNSSDNDKVNSLQDLENAWQMF